MKNKKLQKKSEHVDSIRLEGSIDSDVILEEIKEIKNNIALSWPDKRKLTKQALKKYYEAKELEIDKIMDLFYNTLLAKKDIALKKISLDFQNIIQNLEKEHTNLMSDLGITSHDDTSSLLIRLGETATKNLDKINEKEIPDELKNQIIKGIKDTFRKTYKNIMERVDSLIDNLKIQETSATQKYIPVSVYLSEYDPQLTKSLISAVINFLSTYNIEISKDSPPEKSSWFQKLLFKTKDQLSQPEMIEKLKKIERAIEMHTMEKPQGEIDKSQAEAVARLIEALSKNKSEAILKVGSIILVKRIDNQGNDSFIAKTLTQKEIILLEEKPELLKNPTLIFDALSLSNKKTKHLKTTDNLC